MPSGRYLGQDKIRAASAKSQVKAQEENKNVLELKRESTLLLNVEPAGVNADGAVHGRQAEDVDIFKRIIICFSV